jgi:hypothetical protein
LALRRPRESEDDPEELLLPFRHEVLLPEEELFAASSFTSATALATAIGAISTASCNL